MPGKFKFTYLPLIIAYLLLTVGMSFSYAQKKKPKSKVLQQRNAKLSQVKPEDQMQAEYLFTEGVKNAIIDDYPKAISYINRSLELNPGNSAAYYKLAEIHLKTGNIQEAEENIQLALEKEKSNKYYYIMAADIQTQKGNYQDAAALYETMLKETEAGPQHRLELAVLYLHLRDFTKAIKTFDEAEKALGVNEQIILQKQKLYLEQNKLPEAIKEGEKLVKNFPNEPAYVIRQAELLMNNQRLNEAKAYLQNYLQQQPEQPQAQYLLAKISQQQGNFKAAEESLQKAFNNPEMALEVKVQEVARLIEELPGKEIQLLLEKLTSEIVTTHPDEFQAYVVRGDFLFAINNKQSARDSYLQALELDKSNFNVWQNALSLGIELGRFDSVAKEADQALELFPNQASLYYFSGAANLSLKSYEEAVFALEQGKKLAGLNQELAGIFNSHLGDAYHSMEEYAKSDAAYEAALRASPENDYILNNYSYYLSLRQEKLAQALEMSEKLTKKHPNNPTYLDTHAWVLYQLKEYSKAKQLLEKAIANKGDEDGTIVEHYGDVLFQLNQKEEALQQWKKAKELPNTSDLLDKKIKEQKLYE